MGPRAVSKAIQKRRSDELIRILEDVAVDDANVVKAGRKGFTVGRGELTRVELMEEGADKEQAFRLLGFESREDFEIACEARRPNSEAATAYHHAHLRTGMRIRQAVEQAPKTLNVAIMLPAPQQMTKDQQRRAPVIDVEPGGEK